jgi:hypothetical protein
LEPSIYQILAEAISLPLMATAYRNSTSVFAYVLEDDLVSVRDIAHVTLEDRDITITSMDNPYYPPRRTIVLNLYDPELIDKFLKAIDGIIGDADNICIPTPELIRKLHPINENRCIIKDMLIENINDFDGVDVQKLLEDNSEVPGVL